MKHYKLTESQKHFFPTKFQSRTYGSRITEYIPHESRTLLLPNSIQQMITIANPPFVTSSQLPETRIISLH